MSQLTYDRTPPIWWLPGNGFISGGRGGTPFFVHPDWVHQHQNRLIPGENIPLQLSVASGHVFLSGDWWTTQVAAESEKAPYAQILQCLLAVVTPLQFPFVFRNLASLDPWTAVEVLERGGLKALGGVIEVPAEHLEANDLRELLNSGECSIRHRASSWLSQPGDRAVATSSMDDAPLSSEQ